MLDRLDVGLYDKVSGHHDGTCKRHEGKPATDQQDGDEQDSKSDPQLIFK